MGVEDKAVMMDRYQITNWITDMLLGVLGSVVLAFQKYQFSNEGLCLMGKPVLMYKSSLCSRFDVT